ncbi:MAG TPA: hypothetical protein VGO93_01910 [Candidatus Xenobia bacterium]
MPKTAAGDEKVAHFYHEGAVNAHPQARDSIHDMAVFVGVPSKGKQVLL